MFLPEFYGDLGYKLKKIVGSNNFCRVLLCFRTRLFIDALWSPAGKGLTSWLPFEMSNCDVFTFPSVSCVKWVA